MKTVFVLVDGQIVPLKDAIKNSRQQHIDEHGEVEENNCFILGKSQEISTDENDVNQHFFMEDSFVFQIMKRKITAIHVHCFVSILGIICLLSALGGNFVDDDLVNAPFLELTYSSDIIGLRIASLASCFPLLWDLLVDIYNVNYRGSDPAEHADREEYRRAKLVCKKEIWLRMGFIVALSLPSAVLLLSDARHAISGRAVLPFLTQFVRIIVIFCMSNGYLSELYDVTRRERFGTLMISISFVIGRTHLLTSQYCSHTLITTNLLLLKHFYHLGITLVFYGRIMMSRAIATAGIGAIFGLVTAGISTSLFVCRVIWRTGRLFCKEMVSIQSIIQMEEYVFICYSMGACYLCVILFCSFFGHNGTMQYDKLTFSGLLTYHILFPLGVITSVIVSARAVRNWSLEVRYELVASRLTKLEIVIDEELIDRRCFNGVRLESHQEGDLSIELSEINKKSLREPVNVPLIIPLI